MSRWLRMISERSGNLGRIVTSLVGLAWNLATYLVVPVLVIEGVGPVEAIKRSAGLLKCNASGRKNSASKS